MHDNLLMLNREIFFEQNLTLSFISAVQVRFLFRAIYFLLKELRRETIWKVRFRFFVVKPLLNWTFFLYFPSTMYGLQISFVVCHCSKQVECGKYWWRFQNSKFPLGFFSQSLFASLPNIYYWVSFITNCISWQPILAQNSCDEVSWEFKQNPQFFQHKPSGHFVSY